jgi:cellulose synthase/poly-beta-1,6-N-acetylglucosamine synthase-like glycosyltransferase
VEVSIELNALAGLFASEKNLRNTLIPECWSQDQRWQKEAMNSRVHSFFAFN